MRWLVVGMFAVLALLGATIALVMTFSSPRREDPTSSPKNDSKHFQSKSIAGNTTKRGGKFAVRDNVTESDPRREVYSVTALAIGDWGRTIAKEGGSCCSRRKNYTVMDYNAMEYTASLLGLAAKEATPKPSVIIGHGDNFYWTGLQSVKDQAYRFQQTFEEKYSDPALQGIPWVNVLGNHDYGGASFICANGDAPAKCESTEELVANLKLKFSLQAGYKSPFEDRWILKDHFYVHHVIDRSSGLTVDIFNMDTNDADSHGARQICCQCYAYAGGNDAMCEQITRGQPYCAGGDTDMYDQCMRQLKEWGEDSRRQLVSAVQASNATWKIVNTHYSPYAHYEPKQADMWKDVLAKLDLQLVMFGHTHGEKHDHASFRMHFIENGAGGGIQNESPSGIPPYAQPYMSNIWSAGHYPYGIFALRFSPQWLQVRFMTFDDKWIMTKDVDNTTIGGIAVRHCWFIPVHGGKGLPCNDTTS
ncbi:TPA: hypothetical protein N0F65_008429 [Lagenidium giganteum]|uniref:Calcineurin-like phosphoesterase domain-containing protein n=1 Tax=Lagenidium giganteum TaxID=4803 RepID=A0AAV2YMU7_9STRA|nr:TPA: hypothetical protein N0F65_008429 [Lagenidium giganteum]